MQNIFKKRKQCKNIHNMHRICEIICNENAKYLQNICKIFEEYAKKNAEYAKNMQTI